MASSIDGGYMTFYRQGKLRGDKVQYQDGIGCCIWHPSVQEGKDEDTGLCWDFSFEDIDDLIALLQTLKDAPAEEFKE